MKNGRCRMHGGASTGPSAEGRARIAAARTIHGARTAPMRALARTSAATQRRIAILATMIRAGLKVEDLAAPIRQCRSVPPPRKPPTPTRERCFVLRELTAMAFSAAEGRSLRHAIAPPAQKPIHREAKPQPAAPAPKPPRQPLVCRPARQRLPCRRLDPANPFPASTNPHAPWKRDRRRPYAIAPRRIPNRMDQTPRRPYTQHP